MAEETEKKVKRIRKVAAAVADGQENMEHSPAAAAEASPAAEGGAAASVEASAPAAPEKAEKEQGSSEASPSQEQVQQNAQQQQRPQENLSKKQRWLQQHGRFRGRNGNNHQHGNNAPAQMQQVPRDPNLPEYKLPDIHSWDNATIVERMCPDANAEDLSAMKRHDIIFNAIRSYLARGGAVMASGCLEIVREGYGYLRSAKTNFLACPEDVFVPQQQIR
ncbi:MAG: hypothetical protein J6R18_08815, partial [Kiritimatiellae bacterium]|nr:hypothetical protein [Kiritimatiellia bacterium]